MLIVISPAKTLDLSSTDLAFTPSQPQFLSQAEELVGLMRKKSRAEIGELMHISEKLADLNFDRYAAFSTPFSEENAKAAVLTFKGDVYVGLDAASMDEQALNFAQQHLRILSGLYGLLRPLDLMQAYRLEMGTRLQNPKGKNLYEYWGSSITEALNTELAQQKQQVLIDLASTEYFKAIQKKGLNARVITPVFKDFKNGKYKVISFFAKKARGMMSRYIIDQQLTDAEQIKAFNTAGYYFNAEESTADKWVFYRDEA